MTHQFLMLLRNTDWDRGLTTEEISACIGKYNAWFDRVMKEGRISTGTPLLGSGRLVSKNGERVSDGPFIESKESIGGYIVIHAADYDDAVRFVKTFPPVEMGVEVEIRQLTPVCPVSARLEASLQAATEPAVV